MTRTVTIALLWHSMNSDNLGVGALTLSNAEILRAAAAKAGVTPHFLAMSWQDPRPDYGTWADIENLHFRTRHIPGPSGPLAEGLKRADIVIDIGGGDSFADIYGLKRFLTVWATKLHTIRMGKPLILSPQTIGPFDTAYAPPLARWAMNRSRLVVSRDAPTTAFLEAIGVRSDRVLEATDVAMRLPHDAPAPRPEGGLVRVGLNVSGLLMNGGYTKANQFGLKGDYPALIRRIIGRFHGRDDVELHLVGHVQSRGIAVEDDHRANEALAKEFPGVKVSPFFTSPIEAKSYIAGMDFFMGARMHATIAAFSSRVPVVPMAYSRKFAGVFGTLGYNRVVDCKSDSDDEILARIEEGFANRGQLRAEIDAALVKVDVRLDRYTDLVAEELSRL
ncbi:polysaccharide pyruvyl transferase family protein [Cereibacter sphaeroides]|uniref:polysaccharide pyruvyl transferase family protein n=1 Tax=Cereibacter sphaeroides TaxID=1063 RepID=UPI001F37E66D|nr:polysaccharide pyruvyl transferase family protein [Cereibacter sphaeroides]MCE6950234.1 polysaccharide pyruvyl transferase family protein [Cereibacter sphaeroides]MCE6958658.1 polysaccharide pyruvyl transferase family protein [Cereibacter sphaeroides]MCE6973459.1 polysaccharide pyruvyl transferase family protein [Cereibacter sphaeroides]